MTTWTIDQYKQHLQGKKAVPHATTKNRGSKAKDEIEMMLLLTGEVFIKEHVFSNTRKFRFDWAIPAHKIAIEYEGIISGKSRHTTIDGYSRDADKYNLAITEGWRVLRYTAKNYKNLSKDLNELLTSTK